MTTTDLDIDERLVPSVMDGLRLAEREVLYTCFNHSEKREMNVALLAGAVASHSAYDHSAEQFTSSIIDMARSYVGTNNLNLLIPIGQFGTRHANGKDVGKPSDLYTKLSPLTRFLFPKLDDPLLNYLYDDKRQVEPEYYVPIVPMVLVNGVRGKDGKIIVYNHNPRDLVAYIKKKLCDEDGRRLAPWYKNFRGSITRHPDNHNYCHVKGRIDRLGTDKVAITDLPFGTTIGDYRYRCEFMMRTQYISAYKEDHVDDNIRFELTLTDRKIKVAITENWFNVFRLQSHISTPSMVLHDHLGIVKKYEAVEQIMFEFYCIRFLLYQKRKAYWEGMLAAEVKKLENQARFIAEQLDGTLKIDDTKSYELDAILLDRGYDSDPIKAFEKEWKEKDEDALLVMKAVGDVNYLLNMSVWSVLHEKVEELHEKRNCKLAELEKLKNTSIEQLWIEELDAFSDALDIYENECILHEKLSTTAL